MIGQIHLFNLSVPLVLRGRAKKVIALSSAMADPDLTAKFDINDSAPYSICRAALNMAVAKFSVQYVDDGVLFMSITPGIVDNGLHANGKRTFQRVCFAKYHRFNN